MASHNPTSRSSVDVSPPLACVILAAGKGSRMQSSLPKVLHEVGRKPMIRHVADAMTAAEADRIALVVSPDHLVIGDHVPEAQIVPQPVPLGTGDAVKFARTALRAPHNDTDQEGEPTDDFDGDIVVVFGDTPLIDADLIQRMRPSASKEDVAICVAGVEMPKESRYGRLVQDQDGHLIEITEYREASEAVRNLTLCNGGIMGIRASVLWELLETVEPAAETGEIYLTSILKPAKERGLKAQIVEADPISCFGVDTRQALAKAEGYFQDRKRAQVMANGASLRAPETVWFAADTVVGRDVTIDAFVTFGPGVVIEDHVEIKSHCDFKGCHISRDTIVGPYARLRPDAKIGIGARIGNFVEVKNAEICEGAKISHLSYIGDARIGRNANIGAGVITCNYDGYHKHFTNVGDYAFVGSNSALVAPISLGNHSTVGAGSVIRRDVPSETLSVHRSEQSHKTGWVPKSQRLAQNAE